jgi:hypothetical protein
MLKFEDFIKLFEDINRLPGISSDQTVKSWVNTKIDNDLDIRVSRYAKAIDSLISSKDSKNISAKLSVLEQFTDNLGNVDQGIRSKIAIIILLQYLRELKANFDGSSSGFLFENYIAGLVHESKTPGNKVEDLELNNYKFQMKFVLFKTSDIKISSIEQKNKILINGEDPCHYYIIGLKDEDRVLIWILGDDITYFNKKSPLIEPNYKLSKYLLDPIKVIDNNELKYKDLLNKKNIEDITLDDVDKIIDISKLKNTIKRKKYNKNKGLGQITKLDGAPYIIDFTNMDTIFTNVTKGIKKSIEDVFENLSDLHYNIETIMTGINKFREKQKDIDQTYSYIENNTKEIINNLKNIKNDFENE